MGADTCGRSPRSPSNSDDHTESSVFSLVLTSIDAPESPLSDYPDNLSQCSAGRADPWAKHNLENQGACENEELGDDPSAGVVNEGRRGRSLPCDLEDSPEYRNGYGTTEETGSREKNGPQFSHCPGPTDPDHTIHPTEHFCKPLSNVEDKTKQPTQPRNLRPRQKPTATPMAPINTPDPQPSGPRRSARKATNASRKRRRSPSASSIKKKTIPSTVVTVQKDGPSTTAEPGVKPSMIVKLQIRLSQPSSEPDPSQSQLDQVARRPSKPQSAELTESLEGHAQTLVAPSRQTKKRKATTQPKVRAAEPQSAELTNSLEGNAQTLVAPSRQTKKRKAITQPKVRAAAHQDKPSLIVKLKCSFPLATPDRTPSQSSVNRNPQLTSTSNVEIDLSELERIARALVTMSQRTKKPDPVNQPEIWAETRQELCETLPYFRAYHASTHATGGFVYGYMFDKTSFCRDYTDSNVVISRAGGGMVKDKDSGDMVLGGDQTHGTATQSLRNCMQSYNPVVLITGVDNPTMPCKPPHTYCVLDYFKPTHIWCEKSKGKTVIRYRFEKLCLSKPSWWQGGDEVALGELPAPIVNDCTICNVQSPQVYLQGWMCLEPSCQGFWKLSDGTEPDEVGIIYDPRFLKQKITWPNDDQDYPLKPSDVELSSHAIPGEDRSRAHWAGIVCPHCGRCTLRLAWLAWECPCDYRKVPPHTLIPAKALRDPFFPISRAYTPSRDIHIPAIRLEISFKNNYRINKYTLPGIDGFVAHLVANKPIVEEAGGPDDMFEALQTEDIGLYRRPLDSGQIKSGGVTRHFLVNYGMPYKFIVATASRSFDGAARPITSTRSRLNWASKLIVEGEHQEFNEVLALGYFEEQRINYHDDGEFGLGPTIATLSLGAPGTMRLRMKANHYHGASKAGVFTDAIPKPGCYKYEERLAAISELEALKATSGPDYRARLKSLPKDLGLKRVGNARDAITLTLGHGDIVIMHGAEIQKYYEHAVEHAGKLRFALTCRYIDPGSLREADKPVYEVGPDTGVYDGSKI